MWRARVLNAVGRLTEAADHCTRAALDLAPSDDLRLLGIIQQNAVHYLAQAGEPRPARYLQTLNLSHCGVRG